MTQIYNKSLVPYKSMLLKVIHNMDIFNKIERVLSYKKLSQNALIKALGVTSAGFYKMKKNNDLKISTLENICQFLDISVCDLLKMDYAELPNIGKFEVNEAPQSYIVDKNGISKDFEELKKLVDKINTKLK